VFASFAGVCAHARPTPNPTTPAASHSRLIPLLDDNTLSSATPIRKTICSQQLATLPPMRRNTPSTPRLLIRSSSIHAAGVVTLDPISRGRRILEYDGPRISNEVADDRYAEKPVTYLFSIDGSTDVIDGFAAAMFVNHSCAPNCETEEDNGRVYIKAIRNIAAGEELVYEYNLHDSDDESADCYCGAPHCRGTMFSDEELKRRARRTKRKATKNR